ncbi:hypothetical protein V474_03235 [Novosphingobium barchaimii LL02]|uniref:Uncharacterized protein n=1 Tax=Novosphingobium barchaimii LL02 TaxID=1114963 RepID=A0A0J7XIS9_9SPHN|nr:hypothetical protein [Novosphingobium barchaimii]KMS51657.1 hypothetical protein V474_03235 [Novosphingobium barchaimii LL02]
MLLRVLVTGVIAWLAATAAIAGERDRGIGVVHLTFVDETRAVRAANGFAGSTDRRIDVTVWYPNDVADGARASRTRLPLVLYSHGSYGQADNAMYLVSDLVRAGYVVAAPDYPLSSRAAYTEVTASDPGDVAQQARDIHFVIDRLLADKALAALIDPAKIATMGHSLGAVTSYFASFASTVREPRVAATVLLGAGDPVQAALSGNMGLAGAWHVPAPVPALFLSAEHDAFARFTGRPYAAFARLEKPKYEIMVKGGVHVWFTDTNDQLPDGGNPDCTHLGPNAASLPGCEPGVKLIAPLRQKEITRTAVRDFLDGYLKGDRSRIEALRRLGTSIPEIEQRTED